MIAQSSTAAWIIDVLSVVVAIRLTSPVSRMLGPAGRNILMRIMGIAVTAIGFGLLG